MRVEETGLVREERIKKVSVQMSATMYDIIKRLFEAKNEWVGIDIGGIAGSNHLSLEQHAGFGSGQLVLRLQDEMRGEYHFDLEDFHVARQLAHGLLGWADVAERLYEEREAEYKAKHEAGK